MQSHYHTQLNRGGGRGTGSGHGLGQGLGSASLDLGQSLSALVDGVGAGGGVGGVGVDVSNGHRMMQPPMKRLISRRSGGSGGPLASASSEGTLPRRR